MASADCGPSLFTLGIICCGEMNRTNSFSSVKLLCSLYGTSYLERGNNTTFMKNTFFLKNLKLNVTKRNNIHAKRSSWSAPSLMKGNKS